MARKQSRCKCGRTKSQYAGYCRKCTAERDAGRIAEALAVISTGRCPQCGEALKRNLSMTGWWQCSQYGAATHRADANKASCSFQTSTA